MVTPPPATTRSPTEAATSRIRASNCMAFGSPADARAPDVKTRSNPTAAAARSAAIGFLDTSIARCNVTGSGRAAATKREHIFVSKSPSAVSAPVTMPSAPRRLYMRMFSSMQSISSAEYKKSPPRGRTKTRIGIRTRRFRALRRPGLGLTPPSTRLEQSSSRSAPPRSASTPEVTESTHASKSGQGVDCTARKRRRALPLPMCDKTAPRTAPPAKLAAAPQRKASDMQSRFDFCCHFFL